MARWPVVEIREGLWGTIACACRMIQAISLNPRKEIGFLAE